MIARRFLRDRDAPPEPEKPEATAEGRIRAGLVLEELELFKAPLFNREPYVVVIALGEAGPIRVAQSGVFTRVKGGDVVRPEPEMQTLMDAADFGGWVKAAVLVMESDAGARQAARRVGDFLDRESSKLNRLAIAASGGRGIGPIAVAIRETAEALAGWLSRNPDDVLLREELTLVEPPSGASFELRSKRARVKLSWVLPEGRIFRPDEDRAEKASDEPPPKAKSSGLTPDEDAPKKEGSP